MSQIITVVVAVYAAGVATATGLVQIFNYRRDRARVRLSVQHKMKIMFDSRYEGQTLTIVTVANEGRRPVTIRSVGAATLYPQDPFVIPHFQPLLPHELTEGKSLMAILPPCDIDFSKIESWQAWDALGRRYRLHVAPWWLRAISHARLRRQWRKDRAASAELSAPQS
jgi:hypothetical protein